MLSLHSRPAPVSTSSGERKVLLLLYGSGALAAARHACWGCRDFGVGAGCGGAGCVRLSCPARKEPGEQRPPLQVCLRPARKLSRPLCLLCTLLSPTSADGPCQHPRRPSTPKTQPNTANGARSPSWVRTHAPRPTDPSPLALGSSMAWPGAVLRRVRHGGHQKRDIASSGP